MRVIKRNGAEVEFDIVKIIAAVTKANDVVDEEARMTPVQIQRIAESVEFSCQSLGRAPTVEEIQDFVEHQIMAHGAFEVAKRYITYRYNRSLVRKSNTTDDKILSLIECNNEEAKQENSNKNPVVNSTQRDYMAGEVSRDLTNRLLLPEDIVKAHEEGIIHFHDTDYYAQHMHNCDLVNLEDMLQNGTVITGTLIERPHSFATACNIATQIVAQVASNQYGGQSISLTHLAPFVDVSRQKIRKQVLAEVEALGVDPTEDKITEIVEKRLREEIRRGVQTIQYQVVTLLTTNGQAPFITVFMYLNEARSEQEKRDLAVIIEEMLEQRYQGVKNEQGVWVTPAFPKLIYVLEEDNIHDDSPYYYLTQLAAKCTARRMVPDYISEKKMLELKGDVYPCMGCRSFLTPDRFTDAGVGNIANAGNYVPGKHKYYGRFNQGVVTINLPDVALSSGGNIEKFWTIFEERLELCHRALRCRHDRLKGTLSDAAPILWQYGACARLKKGEPIDKLLYDLARLRGTLRVREVHDRQEPHRPQRNALRPVDHAEDERQVQGVENRRKHRLLPLRNAARVHDLQVRQVPAKALRRDRGRDGQGLYHELLPRPRDGKDRRVHQAQVRGAVPAPLPRRRDQLCRSAQHAAEP